MSLKLVLVLMTAIAVVSDSLLHPFYPQYFATVYGVRDPQHVGYYIAACSLTVILSFPLWARLTRTRAVLRLLVVTQLATGLLSIACYEATSLVAFWVCSLLMMLFKSSYLLIYPFVLSLDDKANHLGTISLLAFVVYFGNILSALLSGTIFELVDARSLFLVMACGDALQIALCLLSAQGMRAPTPDAPRPDAARPPPARFVGRLGVVMFVLYFSAYLTEPFFGRYWESVSGTENKIVSGAVFAIPGLAALVGLYINSAAPNSRLARGGIPSAIVLGMLGLLLQVTASALALVAGRVLYGWALFQSMVRLDALLFDVSERESYAIDFSTVNLYQGLGVLFASCTAGSLVLEHSARLPFVVAAGGFAVGVLLHRSLLKPQATAPHFEAAASGARGTAP